MRQNHTKRDYARPRMTVVKLRERAWMLQSASPNGMAGRKSYTVDNTNPFGGPASTRGYIEDDEFDE